MRDALPSFLACALLSASAGADTLTHSGYLLGSADQPVSALVPMHFRVLDAPADGTELWTSGL